MKDSCFETQQYFAFDLWEAIFLVASNLILIPVVFRAYKFGFYTRAYLYMADFCASFLYHLCIIQPLSGASCVFHLCTLKHLDYTFSYTVLFSSLLFFIPFKAMYDPPKDSIEARKGKKPRKIKPDVTYIEDWIIYTILIVVGIMVSEVNGFEPLTWLQIFVIVIILLLINTVAWAHLYTAFHRKPEFDVVDLICFVCLAVIAVIFFLIEYNLSPRSYWITHSLWHKFAGLCLLYLIESRNKKRSGCWVILPR